MTNRLILELLKERIGLDPAAVGEAVIGNAVADAMRDLKMTDPTAYANQVAVNTRDFNDLVNRLVVSETWFFRGSFFSSLPGLVRAKANGRFRILSVPCSTGEEPYSIAMTLLEAGVPATNWSIDAIDISDRAIAVARRGVYRSFSFRQTDAAIRSRYFAPAGENWQLSTDILSTVNFQVGNLLQLDPSALSEKYDLILCRNLLIYLTTDARKRVLDVVESMLVYDGYVALGPAEPPSLAGRSFAPFGTDSDFLFQRVAAPPIGLRPIPVVVYPMPATQPKPRTTSTRKRSIPAAKTTDWSNARQLADLGRLDDAEAECRRGLKQSGHSAEGYALLGVIAQARGQLDAADEAFRKALYLDPNQVEALTHGALLCDQRGQNDRAATLRQRLARVTADGGGA